MANLKIAMTLFVLACGLTPLNAHAWGKRGHATVCEAAAYVAADAPETHGKAEFLKTHSYDLGYYCNVPDLVWKQPATYDQEWFNHFMDMEIFNREIKAGDLQKAFAMDRVTFNKTYPQIPNKAGRSFWRIRELIGDGTKIGEQLKNKDLSIEERHRLQTEWLLHMGIAGHYVGDLSQPLHVTENYDGQFSGQKGVHTYFEDDAVDELFNLDHKEVEAEVIAMAQKKWKTLGTTWEKKPILDVLNEMAEQSNGKIGQLFAIDKKVGRKDIAKAARAYHDMIVDRMSTGAVALAAFWSQGLGWDYDGKKFFTFVSTPAFIAPPGMESPAPAPAPKSLAKAPAATETPGFAPSAPSTN